MKTAIHKPAALAAAAALTLGLALAQAAPVLVDDYESYALGANILNTNDYVGGNNGTEIIADADGGDQALLVDGDPGTGPNLAKFNAISVEDGSTGTLFFQMRFDVTAEPNFVFSVGTGDDFFPNTLAFKVRGNPATGLELQAADGTPISTIDPSVTYDVYAVINNDAGAGDNLDLYLQSDADPDFAALTQVGAAQAFTKDFGGQPGTDTMNAFVFSSFAEPGATIDNVYYDDAGVNLTNPIPEPAAAAAALGLAVPALRRRR